MASTSTLLTSGAANDTAAPSSAPISPTANRLILAKIHSNSGGAVTAVACGALSFTKVAEVVSDTPYPGTFNTSVWRAMSASPPSSTPVGITMSSTSDTVLWSIEEKGDVDTGGTNGSAAIVQSAVNQVQSGNTGITVTLGAFGSANNATDATFGTWNANVTATPGSGFSEITDLVNYHSSYGFYEGIHTEWRADNDTTADVTFSATVGYSSGIALEIKAAAAAGFQAAWARNANSIITVH